MYALVDETGRKRLAGGKAGDGEFVIDGKRLQASEGKVLSIGGKRFLVLPASLLDRLECIERKAQIVMPKDAATVVFNCGIGPGSVVVEAGIGSGALTIALAHFVGPEGKVVSYEIREEFAALARRNLERAGLSDRVEVRLADVTKGIEERNADAVVLDLPTPWEAVAHARTALRPGGAFCSLSPNSAHVVRTVEELGRQGFVDVQTLENLQRRMLVRDGWMRPEETLAHTCYLTFARAAAEGFN